MLVMAQSGIDAMAEALEKEAANNGMKVVFKERFNKDVNDFKTTLLKAEKTKPDIYYLVSFPPSIDIIGRQYKELGLKTPLSGDAFDLSKNMKIFEGDWYVNPILINKDLMAKFQAKYPNTLFSARTAPYGYDSFNLLVQAFDNGKSSPASYITDLTSFSGMAGLLTKGADGFFQSEDGVWIIKDGFPVQAS